jgi:hypothetical protein
VRNDKLHQQRRNKGREKKKRKQRGNMRNGGLT